ncbi:MAG: hypothetical protein AB3N24_17110 [Leisingera sp.]
MKRIQLAVAVALAGFGVQPAAAETVYDCDIKVFTNNGWIAPRVLVMWDEKLETAKVYDGYIHEYVGEPLEARVEKRNEFSFNLYWRVDHIPVSNARTRLDAQYTGVFNTKQNTLSIRGVIGAVSNQPRGRGKCKVRQG